MRYATTAHNRTVYAAPSVSGSDYEKCHITTRTLCGVLVKECVAFQSKVNTNLLGEVLPHNIFLLKYFLQ